MKKTGFIFLTLAIVGAMTVSAFAAGVPSSAPVKETVTAVTEAAENNGADYTIEVNGEKVDAKACVMVPLRAVSEQLGFTVTYHDGEILVDNQVIHTTVTIGEDEYTVVTSLQGMVGMSAPFSLGAAPYVTNGVTYVPLQLFDALLGNVDGAIKAEGNTIVIQTKENTGAQLVNPFVDCNTLNDAEKIAGFDVAAPDAVDGYSERIIQAVENDLIQIIFQDGDNNLTVRKAVGTDDISGDFIEYAEISTVTVTGLQVTMKGSGGKVNVATWTDGGYTYAVRVVEEGISSTCMRALIQTIW